MADDSEFARLVSLACHDLRTPLATVHGFATTLERGGGLEPPADRYVEMIDAASAQLAELIDELSLVARIESGRYDPTPREADTLELAQAAAARLGEERVRVTGSGAALETDADAVERGLAALFQSALRHGGLDSVEVEVDGAEIRLSRVTAASAPVVLGDDLRDLGAAVAVRLVRRLGGSVSVDGETLEDPARSSAGGEGGRRELVARAAARLVLLERPDDDRVAVGGGGRAVDESLGHRRRPAAAVADRLQLVHELGAAEELGHRAEREAAEVLVEPARDDPQPALDEPVEDERDLRREELNLVHADDVVAVDEAGDVGGVVDGDRAHPGARMADDVADVVAVVDARLDDQHPLAGDLRTPQPPDELLALAAEHRAADDLEPAAVIREEPDHRSDPRGPVRRTRLADRLLRVLELVLREAAEADDAE